MTSLYEQIIATYPELTDKNYIFQGIIILQNDADNLGDYIAEWHYEKPIPEGLKLGK